MAIDQHKPKNLGFTGKVGGSLKDRAYATARDAEGRVYIVGENAEDRAGWTREHKPTRNLKPLKHPKRTRESRDVTVTLASGASFTLNSRLQSKRKVREVKPAEYKREHFAIGADYAETWQTAQSANTGETRKAEYYFRGKYYDNLADYESAILAL